VVGAIAIEEFGGITPGTLRIRTGEPLAGAKQVPGLSPPVAIALLTTLLLLGSVLVVRRRAPWRAGD